MHRLFDLMIFLMCVVLVVAYINLAVQMQETKEKLDSIQADVSALEREGERLQSMLDALPTASEPPAPEFEPLDIALPVDLQEYLFEQCEAAGIDPYIVVAIGAHESGWEWPGEVMDANGLPSVGYMQINRPHWNRLADMGIDVHTPEGNIDAGIQILSELTDKYPLERALVAYQCGETGARGVTSTEFSREVLAHVT